MTLGTHTWPRDIIGLSMIVWLSGCIPEAPSFQIGKARIRPGYNVTIHEVDGGNENEFQEGTLQTGPHYLYDLPPGVHSFKVDWVSYADGSRSYTTDMVEIPVKMTAGSVYLVDARSGGGHVSFWVEEAATGLIVAGERPAPRIVGDIAVALQYQRLALAEELDALQEEIGRVVPSESADRRLNRLKSDLARIDLIEVLQRARRKEIKSIDDQSVRDQLMSEVDAMDRSRQRVREIFAAALHSDGVGK